jgi:hypothetical protein
MVRASLALASRARDGHFGGHGRETRNWHGVPVGFGRGVRACSLDLQSECEAERVVPARRLARQLFVQFCSVGEGTAVQRREAPIPLQR